MLALDHAAVAATTPTLRRPPRTYSGFLQKSLFLSNHRLCHAVERSRHLLPAGLPRESRCAPVNWLSAFAVPPPSMQPATPWLKPHRTPVSAETNCELVGTWKPLARTRAPHLDARWGVAFHASDVHRRRGWSAAHNMISGGPYRYPDSQAGSVATWLRRGTQHEDLKIDLTLLYTAGVTSVLCAPSVGRVGRWGRYNRVIQALVGPRAPRALLNCMANA